MKPYYYTFRVGGSHPRVKHATLAQAVTEAERLATQHPGDTFEILQCVAITQTSNASTFYLDGVEPEPEHPTTIQGWLETLPEPYRGAALRNTGELMKKKEKEGSLRDALLNAFEWGKSSEGVDFWSGVSRSNPSNPLPPFPTPEPKWRYFRSGIGAYTWKVMEDGSSPMVRVRGTWSESIQTLPRLVAHFTELTPTESEL